MATPTLQDVIKLLNSIQSSITAIEKELNMVHIKADKAQTKTLIVPHKTSSGKGSSR